MNLDFFASETLYSGNAGFSTKTFWKKKRKWHYKIHWFLISQYSLKASFAQCLNSTFYCSLILLSWLSVTILHINVLGCYFYSQYKKMEILWPKRGKRAYSIIIDWGGQRAQQSGLQFKIWGKWHFAASEICSYTSKPAFSFQL